MTPPLGDAAPPSEPSEGAPEGDAIEVEPVSEAERFERVVGSWDAHGDSHTPRVSDGIAYSAYLRSIGLNDEAAHLLRESAQLGADDDDVAWGWLGASAE